MHPAGLEPATLGSEELRTELAQLILKAAEEMGATALCSSPPPPTTEPQASHATPDVAAIQTSVEQFIQVLPTGLAIGDLRLPGIQENDRPKMCDRLREQLMSLIQSLLSDANKAKVTPSAAPITRA